MPKYPNCVVQLTGTDGNAFAVLSTVRKHLREHLRANGASLADARAEVEEFTQEATNGNYDGLLATCARWVEVH